MVKKGSGPKGPKGKMLIITTDKFILDSVGNGAILVLYNRETVKDLFFQGDDALELSAELGQMERLGWDYERILAELWARYAP